MTNHRLLVSVCFRATLQVISLFLLSLNLILERQEWESKARHIDLLLRNVLQIQPQGDLRP